MDNEKYVTKEVHDLHVARLEAIMEKNLAKHEAIATEIKNNFKTFQTEIRGDIKAINTRIDSINNRFDDMNVRISDIGNKQAYALSKWGIIIAVIIGLGQVAAAIILNFLK